MNIAAHQEPQRKTPALSDNPRVVVVSSPEQIEVLAQGKGLTQDEGLILAARLPGQALEDALFVDVALAVVEVDPHDRGSLDRIGSIRERHPDLPLVAAIHGASLSLVRTLLREGINDVVALPFETAELSQVIVDVAARRKPKKAAKSSVFLAPVIAVTRSTGGCGATSLATHLAAELNASDASHRGAVILDLDLQFGDVADYLGVSPRGSITDLLDARDRVDEDLIRSTAVKSSSGVSVIAAPENIQPLETVDTDNLLRMIGVLRQTYGTIVLDFPANWTNWTLSTALTADAVVLVVELNITSLRQAKRRIDLFRSVGIEDRNIAVVINRAEKRLFRAIDVNDVVNTLQHPVISTVALEAPGLTNAQTQGQLAGAVNRRSRFAGDIANLAQLLRDQYFSPGA